MLEFFKSLPPRHRVAWLIAVAADAIQIGGTPIFFEGVFSPADWVVDIVTGGIMMGLLGWHWSFLPTFAAELIPGLDLVPTWTAAVFLVTRKRKKTAAEQNVQPGAPRQSPGEPEILPPNPGQRA
jgi:hypothetical protein